MATRKSKKSKQRSATSGTKPSKQPNKSAKSPKAERSFSALRDPHFESFAVEWNGSVTELEKLAEKLLGPEWEVRDFAGNDYELVNPAHLKGGWAAAKPALAAAETPSTELPPSVAWELAREIRRHPKAGYAEPLFAVATPPPEDAQDVAALGGAKSKAIAGAMKDSEWSLKNARVVDAWKTTSARGEGTRVGHPDTGYQFHPELDLPRLLLNEDIDLVSEDDDALDPLSGGGVVPSPGHGTATGSVIMSSAGGKHPTVTGPAPKAELIPIRTSTSVVLWSMRNLIRALDHAVARNCHVVSISMGGLGSHALRKAVQRAVSAGIIVIAAAGNKVKFVVHPGGYPESVCVAASNFDDKPWKGSSRGSDVTLAAPGETVWRARVWYDEGQIQTGVEPSSGTSYGTATIAGIAALWLSHHGRANLISAIGGKHLLAPTFKALLAATARRPSNWKTGKYGAGIVDAKALLAADPTQFVPAAAAASKSMTPEEELTMRLATITGMPVDQKGLSAAVGALATSGKKAALRDVGPELAFLASIDDGVRVGLQASATAGAALGKKQTGGLRAALKERKGLVSPSTAKALKL